MAARPFGRGVPTDAMLVRRARAKRGGAGPTGTGRSAAREAFDELVERYQRRATSIAYRLLGNVHDALEVCQEAFVRAYCHLDTLGDANRFGPWLLKIVTNLSLNFRRARGPRLAIENGRWDDGPGWEAAVSDQPNGPAQPGTRLAAAELAERIRRELTALTEQQRTALVLFGIEELPQKQVAQIMGCSVEAVKWHVFQARRKLKIRLADYL